MEEIGKRREKLLCHRRHRVYPVCVLLLNFLLPTLAAPKIRQIFFFKKTFFDSLYIPYTVKNLFILSAGKHIVVQKLSNPYPPCCIFIMEPPSSSFSAECSFLTGEGREGEGGWARSFIPSPLLPRRRCAIKKMQPTLLVVSRLEGEEGGGIFLGCTQLILSPPPLLWLPNTGGGVLCCPDPGYGEKGGKIRRWKNRFCGIELPFVRKGVGGAFFLLPRSLLLFGD